MPTPAEVEDEIAKLVAKGDHGRTPAEVDRLEWLVNFRGGGYRKRKLMKSKKYKKSKKSKKYKRYKKITRRRQR